MGLPYMLENRRQQLRQQGHVLVEHDGHVIVGSQGAAQGREPGRCLQGSAHGRRGVRQRRCLSLRMRADQAGLLDVYLQTLTAVIDRYLHRSSTKKAFPSSTRKN